MTSPTLMSRILWLCVTAARLLLFTDILLRPCHGFRGCVSRWRACCRLLTSPRRPCHGSCDCVLRPRPSRLVSATTNPQARQGQTHSFATSKATRKPSFVHPCHTSRTC